MVHFQVLALTKLKPPSQTRLHKRRTSMNDDFAWTQRPHYVTWNGPQHLVAGNWFSTVHLFLAYLDGVVYNVGSRVHLRKSRI